MQAQQLASYARLLLKWSAVHNLTAIRGVGDVETHHVLDSLAVVPLVRRATRGSGVRVLDVGSGAGLPGIPLAVARPDAHVCLLDASQKRCAFLTQARLELQLANVDVVHARVEKWRASAFDVIVSRAFACLREFILLTRHLLLPGGVWIAMKGPAYQREVLELPAGIGVREVVRLEVPGLGADRYAIVLHPTESAGAALPATGKK
ncbi:MAG: 16S rRNA (guanine(527)-N(7))-methyltransferase RsmG [Gemmatimonadota bacterium]